MGGWRGGEACSGVEYEDEVCWKHWVEAPFVGAARNGRGLV